MFELKFSDKGIDGSDFYEWGVDKIGFFKVELPDRNEPILCYVYSNRNGYYFDSIDDTFNGENMYDNSLFVSKGKLSGYTFYPLIK